MTKPTYHIADNASDNNEATVERRGSVKGKLIGCVEITDGVNHSFVVPESCMVDGTPDDEAVQAYGVNDFYTTTVPLCEPSVLAELRVKAYEVPATNQ